MFEWHLYHANEIIINNLFIMKELDLHKAFKPIEQGLFTMVSTCLNGKNNVMTISRTMVMDFIINLIGCNLHF